MTYMEKVSYPLEKMNNNTTTLVMFAIFVALGIATVVPILQISYAKGTPSCNSVNAHHNPPVCTIHLHR
jgi:hypothetical protein